MLSQIQPHFLYNSLVVIRHLCRENPSLAEETVVEFAIPEGQFGFADA
jgi:sensor histidine kinase YesM